MKRTVLSKKTRLAIKGIHIRSSSAIITHCLPLSSRAKAKLLAGYISDFSDLYAINPKAVKHVPIHPFAGVPFLDPLFKNADGAAFIYAFGLINLK